MSSREKLSDKLSIRLIREDNEYFKTLTINDQKIILNKLKEINEIDINCDDVNLKNKWLMNWLNSR